MNAYIDVKNSSGTLISGWIPVVNWELKRRMDGAGAFSCIVPDSAKAAAIVVKNSVDIYAFIDDGYQLMGSGIVDRIEESVDAQGITTLRLSGDDQVRELTTRTAGFLSLSQLDILGGWLTTGQPGNEGYIYGLCDLGNGTLLAATGNTPGKIYRSTDYGENWTLVFTSGSTKVASITTFGTGTCMAACQDVLYLSFDYGQTWAEHYLPAVAVTLVLGSTTALLFQAYSGSALMVWTTSDSCTTCDDITNLWLTWSYYPSDAVYLGSNVVLLAGTTTTLARSTDAGITWSIITPTTSTNYVSLFSPATNIVLAGTSDGKIARSTNNGVSFGAAVAAAAATATVYDFSMYDDTYVLAAAGGKVYISDDLGVTWAEAGDLGTLTQTRCVLGLVDRALAGGNNAALWQGITINVGITHAAAITALAALAPAGWTFVADASPPNDSILIDFAGESVLAAALMIAERSGVHCYLSSTRTLTFTDTWVASGLRAAGPLLTQVYSDLICGINGLNVERDTYDIVTRCYPYSKSLHNISTSTVSPATGYAKSTTSLYVQHTAAVAAYGIIETTVIFDDVTEPEISTPEATTETANALVTAAVQWLAQRIAPIINYHLTLLHCTVLLSPMQTIVVDYRTKNYALNATLNILEATWSGDANGIQTTEITASDSTYWIDTDDAVLARTVARVNVLAAK